MPRFGAVRFEQLTVGRCDRMLQDILATETLSKARRARTVLGLLCGYAVRDDALLRNPIRDVQRLPMSPKKESVLTAAQITEIRMRMRNWRRTRLDVKKPSWVVPCSFTDSTLLRLADDGSQATSVQETDGIHGG